MGINLSVARGVLSRSNVAGLANAASEAVRIVGAEGLSRPVAQRIGRLLGAAGGRVGGGLGAGAGTAAVTAGASPLIQVPATIVAKEAGSAFGGSVGGFVGMHVGDALYRLDATALRALRHTGSVAT
jgi:hypothetical protein